MKFKDVSIIIACFVMVTLLTACGSTDAPDTTEPIQPTPTSAPAGLDVSEWPTARKYGTMVYDSASERLLMFGGVESFEKYVEFRGIWAYEPANNSWREQGELGPQYVVSAAFDEESQRAIVIGRGDITDKRGDTWAYDPATDTWQQMNPATAPLRRWSPQMVYDAESDRIVLFAGGDMGVDNAFNDTWAYDYNTDTWTEMGPKVSPPDRASHGMVYDPENDRVLLWGGTTEAGVEDLRVWAYDYNTNTWTAQEAPADAPEQRAGFGLFYHPPSDRLIVFGGLSERNGQLVPEITWAYDYDANAWEALASSKDPGKHAYFPMAYAPAADKFIMFGGELDSKRGDKVSDETWAFDPTTNEWENIKRP